ncbi:MAG: type II toxin-antitoxin system Phd/YefM family antitoxin [Anaerolineae bacterium]
MERNIGATDLRQRLTDVLREIHEQHNIYIIETFGRPQAAIVNLEEYEQFQRFRKEREAFFAWLDDTAAKNAERNANLSEEQVLAIIERARQQVSTRTP